jgi:hypothetical protein
LVARQLEKNDPEAELLLDQLTSEIARAPTVKLVTPTGRVVLRLASVFLPKKHYRRCEEQVADMREEVFEALREGKRLRARVLPVVYYLVAIWSILAAIPAGFFERLVRRLR